MQKEPKDYTTDEVMRLIKERLPEDEDELKKRHEIVRINMMGSHAETQEYKQRQEHLRSIEFKLQDITSRKSKQSRWNFPNITLKRALFVLIAVVILWAIFGWKFQWAPISFPGVELVPPISEDYDLTYVPLAILYDSSGSRIESKSGILPGGALKDLSKIVIFLSLRAGGDEAVKVKFISSDTTLGDTAIEGLTDFPLKQEFVLFPGREISADIINFDPVFLLDFYETNPGRIDQYIVVKLDLLEPDTNKLIEEKEVYIHCKNTGQLPIFELEDNNSFFYYPSCLVTNVK